MRSRAPNRSTASARPVRLIGATVAAGTLLLTAACTSTPVTPRGHSSTTSPAGSVAASTASAPAPDITFASTLSQGMNPTTPVSVRVAHGRLTGVTMTNSAGKHVTADLTPSGSSWHTTEVLGYGKTYSVVARAVGADGTPVTKRTTFTTLMPATVISASMQRMGGYGLDDETYGVAIVPVVHFDAPVGNEHAAQQALSVTSSTPVHGVWSWVDNHDVAYRPRGYWPAHTTVTVTAHVYGVRLGPKSYGASDESAKFTTGRKQLTIADDNSPQVDKVRVMDAAGRVLRTMNTSMGQHSGETVDGQYINFYTLDGTYTVLDHENPAIMSSQSYGLPQDAPNGYGKLTVPYSTKISTDGIYLHEYNSTIYDQDHGNDVSEGCLNLRTADAVWFFDHSLAGDPVVVHGARGAPEIQPSEGGYWSVPWSTWVADSA